MCKKKNIFMYFLNYYQPCTIDSVKNRALLKNLPKIRGEKRQWSENRYGLSVVRVYSTTIIIIMACLLLYMFVVFLANQI